MTTTRDSVLKDRLSQAVSRLMSVRIDGERARVSVPVSYPSGSGSAVEVIWNGENCFVSDLGIGHAETEMYGAVEFYDSSARKAADHFGVGFDGLSVFATWASMGKLEAAITAVANASVRAATWAIFRAVEEKEKQRNAELYERVQAVFGASNVIKVSELPGREATWEAHNVVIFPDRHQAVFEFVAHHANSIASKFMMFSDLFQAPVVYSLNSVTKSVEGLGKKGAMLGSVSNVIEMSAPPETFRKYAKAA